MDEEKNTLHSRTEIKINIEDLVITTDLDITRNYFVSLQLSLT